MVTNAQMSCLSLGGKSIIQPQHSKLQNRIDQAITDKLDGKIPEDLLLRKIN